jgi:hypothetical protein
MMGVRYIHAWIMIWYISEISGNRMAILDNNRPTPRAKAVSRMIGIGMKRIAQVIGLFIISIIIRRGISESARLTTPVPMDETENAV